MKTQHYLCSAVIGSVTEALKAQQVLASDAIPSEVIKAERVGGRKGCIYGISFSCAQENNVRATLGAAKINVREWKTLT